MRIAWDDEILVLPTPFLSFPRRRESSAGGYNHGVGIRTQITEFSTAQAISSRHQRSDVPRWGVG